MTATLLWSSHPLDKQKIIFPLKKIHFLNVREQLEAKTNSISGCSSVDSMMLLEEGFEVVSVDASDKMLKQAYKTRWEHRKEEIYDKWSELIYQLVSLDC